MLGPQAVSNEVAVAGIDKPGAKLLQNAEWLGRVRVTPVPDPLLVMELDAGEAEVISLARQLSPCVAIIDERLLGVLHNTCMDFPSREQPGSWLKHSAMA